MAKYKLDDLCEFITDGTHQTPTYCDEGGVVFLSSKNVTERKINWDDVKYIPGSLHEKLYKRLSPRKNDILLAKNGTTGVAAIVDRDEVFDVYVSLALLRPINTIYPKYLFYAVNSPVAKRQFDAGLKGIGVPNLHLGVIRETVINVVDREEQEKICEILDKVAMVIDNRKKELDELDNLIKARFVEMFGTLQDNRNGYDIVTIEEVCSMIKDGTHQTPTYTEDKENGYKFLSSKDVMTQKIDWMDIKYIPADLHEKLYATIQPQRNDILMSKNGVNYGVAAVNDTDEVFDIYVSLALLRPTEVINPVYFRCVINNLDTKRQFDGSTKGIGVPNLHLGEIKKTKILLPPMQLQEEYVLFVNQVDKSKVVVQYQKEFKGYRHLNIE